MELKLEDALMKDGYDNGKGVEVRVHVPVWQITWGVAFGIVVGAPVLALGIFLVLVMFGGLGGALL